MNNSHTPGPWKASGSRVDGPPSYPVPLIIASCSLTDKDGEEKANARLIAAAPELLALLSEFAAEDSQCRTDWLDIKRTARALIAKVSP